MQAPPTPRSRLVAIAIAAVSLVLLRSAVWVLWEQSYFDSDQAITGLMAKQIADWRAFPVVFYGQPYLLAVEPWLIAPVFRVFGTSVMLLKLPLVALNIAIAALLLEILVEEVGLRPGAALLAALFFVLPPPVTASRLVEAQGANIEPFLYALLLWLTRRRPVAFGIVGGIGFLHREFTAYAIAAVVLLEMVHGVFFTRDNLIGKGIALAEMLGIGLAFRTALDHADILGPGTAGTLPPDALHGQVRFWLSRFCWNPAALGPNLRWLVGQNLATLFGWRIGPFSDYVRSGIRGGHLAALVGLLLLLAAAAMLAARRPRGSGPDVQDPAGLPGSAFPSFLVLVALQAVGVYAFASCLVQDPMLVRYTLLALLLPVGIAAWVLQPGRPRAAAAVAMSGILIWTAASLTDNVRVLAEYVRRPPRNEYRHFADFLEEEGIAYGEAPYWTAYAIDFLTDERVTLGSYEKVRIAEYEDIVARHVNQSTTVFVDRPCTDPGAVRFGRWCLAYFERARHARGRSSAGPGTGIAQRPTDRR